MCGQSIEAALLQENLLRCDPNKDDAGIMTKNGNNVHVFDYKDNWHASSEVLQSQSEEEKEEWKVKQQEWEPRQRFAIQMTNTLNEKGLASSRTRRATLTMCVSPLQ
jgi:hypothetical protein